MLVHKYKKYALLVIIVTIVVQVILFGYMDSSLKSFNTVTADMQRVTRMTDNTFINDTVRPQQRRNLQAMREGWLNYISIHKPVLLLKQNGNLVLNNETGVSVVFDPDTMIKEIKRDKYYDVLDKDTGKLIASHVRPQWNLIEVKKILSIIAEPMRAFGPTGDTIIFDSYTGEMIVDNSEDCKDAPQTLGQDGKRYITLDHFHPNNLNPEVNKKITEIDMMWRFDTDPGSGMLYYFSEPENMGKDGNNFSKYPLGEYKREFQEKIILPYSTVGVDNEAMQITVILGAQEDELMLPYKEIAAQRSELMNTLITTHRKFMLIPIVSVVINMFTIIVCVFALNVMTRHCKL